MNFANISPERLLEPQIKAQILEYLKEKSLIRDNDGIISEFTVDQYARRADLVIIRDHDSTAFEVKSDSDSLTRLQAQTEKYLQFFDKVILVTTKKHYKKAQEILPTNVGIWLVSENDVKVMRKGIKKKIKDKEKLLKMMKVRELQNLARKQKYAGDIKRKSEIISHLLKISSDCLRAELFNYIRKRYKLISQKFWMNSSEMKVSVQAVENLKRRVKNKHSNYEDDNKWLENISFALSEIDKFKQ